MSDEAKPDDLPPPEPDPLPRRREQLLDLLRWSRMEACTGLYGALLAAASAWNQQVAASHPGRPELQIHV